jgi:hypothetical protein
MSDATTETQTHAPVSSKRWRIWSAIAVVFLCGLLVGLVATKAYDDYKQQQKWERGLAGLKPRVMTHLTHELRLAPDQRVAVEAIVARAESELLRLRMAQQLRVDETVIHTVEDLKAVLRPEQRTKLSELYGQLQRRWDADRQYVRGLQRE